MSDAPDPAEGRALYGRDPAAYDSGRPEYPEPVWQALESRCGLRTGARVVEIGPGTGLVTRRLLSTGAAVTAVEPNASMAAYLERHVGGPRLEVVNVPFEAADLATGAFDLAVAATSFHWVDRQRGLDTLRRIVRPGGWIAIWWMVFENRAAPDAFAVAAESTLDDEPGEMRAAGGPFQLDVGARCSELSGAGFVEVQSEIISADVTMDAVRTRALYATMATVLRRPAGEQNAVLDALEHLVRSEFGGAVTRTFPTALYTARNP